MVIWEEKVESSVKKIMIYSKRFNCQLYLGESIITTYKNQPVCTIS